MNAQNYRSDIDGLRTVAVMAVVLFHAFPAWLPGGFVGVDVFFVISGYLITGIIAKDLANARFSLIDFYAKRARRIFPALSVVLFACLVAGWFVLLPDEYALLGKHTAGGSAFIANLVLMLEYGYFDISSKYKPLLHLWSLGVEEQFYFVWPALLMFAAAIRFRLIWVAAVVALASFAISLWLTTSNANEAFYLPFSRFWELMLGAALALTSLNWSKNRPVAELASVVGLSSIVGSIILVREGLLFPAPAALFPVIGASLLIAAGPNATINRLVLSNPVAVWIGLISYPLYLWHWPLLSFPAVILSGDTPRSWRIAAVVASLILAAVTFLLVEKPIRKLGNLRLVASVSTALLILLFGTGIYVYKSGGVTARPMVQAMEAVQSDFEGSMWRFTKNDACLERYSVPDQQAYGWWFCMLREGSAPPVLLTGDSFANQYFAGLAQNEAFRGREILSIGTCEPSIIRPEDVVQVSESFSPCTPQRKWDQQELVRSILANERPKLVILGEVLPTIPGAVPLPTEDYVERLLERIADFRAAGANVVVILPHIRSTYFVRGCFGRPLAEPQFSCEFPTSLDEFKSASAPLVEAVKRRFPSGVVVFDPNDVFCSDGSCDFIINERPAFRDEYDHFTANSSVIAVEYLVKELREKAPTFLQ